jgi:FtsH-binding integral membrane protein
MANRELPGGNRPLRDHVHPVIRRIALGLIAWTVGAVWVLFSHSYYGPLLYGVVTLLVLVFVLLPMILFRMAPQSTGDAASFHDWMNGRFDTASGPIEGREAAVMILLIPMAVAVGMTVLGLAEFLMADGIL